MKGMNVVVINGKEIELNTLPKEEKERLAKEWNHRMLTILGYKRVETA